MFWQKNPDCKNDIVQQSIQKVRATLHLHLDGGVVLFPASAHAPSHLTCASVHHPSTNVYNNVRENHVCHV